MQSQIEVDRLDTATSMSSSKLGSDQAQIDRTRLRNSFRSTLLRWLREPLVQFLLIGAVMFAVYSIMNPGSAKQESPKQIELTMDDLNQLQVVFAAKWQRSPTPIELAGLIESKVREEVLYREAMALGLDQGDTIIKRRMAQKMEFLADDVSTAREPTTEELTTWFEKNKKQFALPGRISFRHLYFSPDVRGQHARADAEEALTKLSAKPGDSLDAAKHGDPFMFQDYYGDRIPEQLAKDFGLNFAETVFQLKTGSWSGPVESGYGWHLLWIDSITSGRIPALEEVEPEVRSAWMSEQRAEQWNKSYEAMRKKYEVYLPKPPEDAATQAK